jgi:hypothetical protein
MKKQSLPSVQRLFSNVNIQGGGHILCLQSTQMQAFVASNMFAINQIVATINISMTGHALTN